MTGGTLTTQRFRLGGGTNTSMGTMTISGEGTELTTSENGTNTVAIGSPGTGVMTISNSATWDHTGLRTVEVGGINSSNASTTGGNGTLHILSAATVTVDVANLDLGRNNGTGVVNVNGGALILSGEGAVIRVGTSTLETVGAGTCLLPVHEIGARAVEIPCADSAEPCSGIEVVGCFIQRKRPASGRPPYRWIASNPGCCGHRRSAARAVS